MKKNVLAAALVAGMGLAGAAVAYDYGTRQDGNAPLNGNEMTGTADQQAPEPVAYQNIYISSGYDYTMREQLIWDFNAPDNAINFTNGFTARMTLKDGAQFDSTYTPSVFNVDPATCVDPDGVGPLPAASATVRTTEDIYLDGTLACTWDVAFDAYYSIGPTGAATAEPNQTVSIRITPKQGITNPQNPSSGLLLRFDNAHLTSLDQFVGSPTIGNVVNGDFWFINPTNDAPFAGSLQSRPILTLVSAVTACTDISGADTDKYIDVADSWLSDDMPKSRFSWDGKLGSSISTGDNFSSDPFTGDYSRQWINLGDVTIGANDVAAGGFEFLGDDEFEVVLTGDTGGWLAFENDSPSLYSDDVWLFDGTCSSGTALMRGEANGSTVTFPVFDADDVGLTGEDGVNLTVCGFVDSDTVINDQNISVTTTFYRDDILGNPQVFPAVGGEACNLLPLRYNGSTMEIFTINPGSNMAQRSFIRLTNRSATDGWVSLEGIQDSGVRTTDPDQAGRSQVRIFIPAGQSVQVYADQLESGTFPGSLTATGAWGTAGAGNKWRAVVTAEFPGLVATSLISNESLRVLTNVTDSDTRGEQYMRDGIEGTLASLPGTRPSDIAQESTPDFRGNGESTGEPGGPNGGPGTGGTTDPCGNEGNGTGSDHGTSTDDRDESNEDPYCTQSIP
ncbi:hypothetical protein [Thermomonas carbonis]|uniref:Uncharacterized protein n=1 Tax=Thermomonas carbonis TaxID=1463158 RepID=A0A7G9SU60_9GAMM|nr:hypothetical protein [Thermomonas carbonis]QNN71385.1 hypothetical protein H9L16_07535 [Thermomonas carbonis]